MASTYTTSLFTVFGDQKVFMGTVHLDDGADQINFGGFQNVNCVVAYPQSVATGGHISVKPNSSAVGYVDFASCASGDALNIMVCGK